MTAIGRILVLLILFMCAFVFGLPGLPAWAEDNPLSVRSINAGSPAWRAGFIVGFLQGSPLKCPNFMSARTLTDSLDEVIRSGRATSDMDARVVLSQLMREGGCTSPQSKDISSF